MMMVMNHVFWISEEVALLKRKRHRDRGRGVVVEDDVEKM